MKVKDIMIKKVITVNLSTKLAEVADILQQNRFHGVPVIDKEGVIQGIITESDFFVKEIPHLYLPSYIDFIKKVKLIKKSSTEKMKAIQKIMQVKASDIMTKKCVCVSPDTDVRTLINIIKKTNYFTIPVTGKNKKIVGVVTTADIINII